ncbi:unnamed protein product [Urochloa humidicola]
MGGAATPTPAPSKARTSKKASAAQVPSAPVPPPDEEGAPASSEQLQSMAPWRTPNRCLTNCLQGSY